MSVIYGLDNVPPGFPESAIGVGVFDGVHWGHRGIFDAVIGVAAQNHLASVALTFDRHPTELLAPAMAPHYITTVEQRVELIHAAGIEHVVVADFEHALANLTHEDFLRKILFDALHGRHVVVGSNFRFGKGRKGDIRYLSAAGPEMGVGVSVVPSVVINDGPVSSTRIRALITRGDVVDAARLLGRRFALRGTVVTGKQIGRTIGFPTANIQTSPRQLIPARGVYSVESAIGKSVYSGLCNIGCRPTFDGDQQTVEVHLMGFAGDIYGQTLDIVFCRRIRDEMTFETPEKLAEQIRQDMERAGCADGC